MSETKKVTMGLTERDAENVQFLVEALHSRSKASAVSQSLSLARALVDAKQHGGKILIKEEDGSIKELLMP